ncbi:DNA-directed DNA polymerase [cyanobiont of Ornithocercus magnificus]|nr:DNA-directed DNA polymerase [cyanobiont of Ornithocercus magnificus]
MLIFDLESDGLLEQATKVHCLVIYDTATNETLVFNDQPPGLCRQPAFGTLAAGLNLLQSAECIAGHNVIRFDLALLKSLYPGEFTYSGRVLDTYLCSVLLYSDIFLKDCDGVPYFMDLVPKHCKGRHKLEAWGYRLGLLKDEFGKTTDWADWSADMEEYCIRDVQITHRLLSLFQRNLNCSLEAGDTPAWIDLEHRVQQILTDQERWGWSFDVESARELAETLTPIRDKRQRELLQIHPYCPHQKVITPKRNNASLGVVADSPYCKLLEFKPRSGEHIKSVLAFYHGWKPSKTAKRTKSGKLSVDKNALAEIAAGGISIASQLREFTDIDDSLQSLSEGADAWLKCCSQEGRIHHTCAVTTVSHRVSHRKPNAGNVPAASEFRRLWRASPGKTMVGGDLKGIELRIFAHLLSHWDGGSYARTLVDGDIHQVNADKMGHGISRDLAKRLVFAMIYGSGNERLGRMVDPTLSTSASQKLGRGIRESYINGIHGYSDLMSAATTAAERGYIKSLDGRELPIRESYRTLNLYIQSSAATIAKRWMILVDRYCKEKRLDAHQLGFIHDELQFECPPPMAPALMAIIKQSAGEAGRYYNLRIPIEADVKTGANWAETH